VAQHAGLSRRILERRFIAAFGHSPGQEIVGARLRFVKSLLVDTDLPVYRIAEQAGFPHAEYLNATFKQKTGLTPRAYRVQMNATNGPRA
jgi:transcriptional regulator GlxA family with amidase domain